MSTDESEALRIIRSRQRREWRETLERDYQQVARRLEGSYRRLVVARLRPETERLTREIVQIVNSGGRPTRLQILDALRVTEILDRVEVDLRGFAGSVQTDARRLQSRAVQQGLGDVFQAALVGGDTRTAGDLAVGAWLRPDPEALVRLIGYVDDPAAIARYERFGTYGSTNLADTILGLTAQGLGPVEIAQRMEQWYNVPFSWAENHLRTVQIYSYRKAQHETARQNEAVLIGWIWSAALDVRTCMSCVSQHGTFHELSEDLNDHHRGRCGPEWVTRGSTWHLEIEQGPDWFARQDATMQREMMGPGLFEAYRAGRFDWDQVSQHYHDDIFGDMIRQASNRSMGIGRGGLPVRNR